MPTPARRAHQLARRAGATMWPWRRRDSLVDRLATRTRTARLDGDLVVDLVVAVGWASLTERLTGVGRRKYWQQQITKRRPFGIVEPWPRPRDAAGQAQRRVRRARARLTQVRAFNVVEPRDPGGSPGG